MNTQEAFDTLIKDLENALANAQITGSQAFQKGRYADAQKAAKSAEEINKHLQNLKNLRGEWDKILVGNATEKPKRTKRKRTNLPHGLKTPLEVYRIPILHALVSVGGSGATREVLKIVESIMAPQLNEHDKSFLGDGRTPRWRNTAQWERQNMVSEGLLKNDSPKGVWEITEAGRAYLKERG